MGELNPRGLPPAKKARVELIRKLINLDHKPGPTDVHGKIVCICGTTVTIMEFQAHLEDEFMRIMDLED